MPANFRPVEIGGALRQHRDRAAFALGDFTQPLRVRRIRRADHDQGIDHRRHLLHRELAVGGGVADVFLVRAGNIRKRSFSIATISAVSSIDSVVWVTKAEIVGVLRLEGRGIMRGLDQRHRPWRQLSERADHFRMVGMPDQQDFTAALEVDRRLAMHLGDQRTGGIERKEIAGAAHPPAPIWARHGPKRSPARWYCRGFRPVPRRRSRLWPSGCRPHSGCGRSRGGHRPARHRWSSACSTEIDRPHHAGAEARGEQSSDLQGRFGLVKCHLGSNHSRSRHGTVNSNKDLPNEDCRPRALSRPASKPLRIPGSNGLYCVQFQSSIDDQTASPPKGRAGRKGDLPWRTHR